MLHVLIANHLRDRLGAARVTARDYHFIQLIEERDGEGNADAGGGGFFS